MVNQLRFVRGVPAASVLLVVAISLFTLSLELYDENRELHTNSSGSDKSNGAPMPFNLTDWAHLWCMAPYEPPLDFEQCDSENGVVHEIPLHGGLTNALKFVLLGAIYSLEENRCFFVNETNAHLHKRVDKSQEFDSFLNRYFEPIGLPASSPIVKKAQEESRIKTLHVLDDLYRDKHRRRIYKDKTSLPQFQYNDFDGHLIKKLILRKLWRPLESVRTRTCATLDKVHRLNDDYIGFSVRRGDKWEKEHVANANLDLYLVEADQIIQQHFAAAAGGDAPPKIFVATDDCSVLDEFRSNRPSWTFVSECDRQERIRDAERGFALDDVPSWTKEQTDAHFNKFFVELYALAIAKFYIGVSTTNGEFLFLPALTIKKSLKSYFVSSCVVGVFHETQSLEFPIG